MAIFTANLMNRKHVLKNNLSLKDDAKLELNRWKVNYNECTLNKHLNTLIATGVLKKFHTFEFYHCARDC